MQAKPLTVLRLQRLASQPPHREPLSAGIPLPRGLLRDEHRLGLVGAAGERVPSQATALARWPDGSLRWVLIDFLHAVGAARDSQVAVRIGDPSPQASPLSIEQTAIDYRVDTGAARFHLPRGLFAPFRQLGATAAGGLAADAELQVEDAAGRPCRARLESLYVEAGGPVRATVVGGGTLLTARERPLCRFAVRLSAFACSGLLQIELTVHNPRRARHRHGLWDLGDSGSIDLRRLAVAVRLSGGAGRLSWRARPDAPAQACRSGRVEIYQASSGGEQWASRAHRDRSGRVPLPFRGCRIRDGAHETRIDRAAPVLSYAAAGTRLSIARPRFWEEFPSALEGSVEAGLVAGLFPRQAAPAELQGGEQKTFTLFVDIGGADDADLAWVHDRSVVSLPPEDIAASGAVPHLVPAAADPHVEYRRLLGEALDGPHSFFAKRETVDEYGWRHFGDTWADHEQLHYRGERPLISHYNNQYDLLYGFLLQFAASGERRWFDLAAPLARHIVDIDLYRTDDDKPAYSGGPFWHTAHYDDAGRATHRSYSADSPLAADRRRYGGGPSCEHVYTAGLLFYHYLTGDPAARAAVIQLADWIVRLDDGAESLLGLVAPGPTGLASSTRSFDYCGPGRGPGNAIAALLDAHRLTADAAYLAKAEELIARCVHPHDDPAAHHLDDADNRWSYVAFLQSLGAYLDRKCELGQRDRAFAYGRASLLRYAEWMVAHEAPYAARAERLEYWTETWPAQDIRKSCVFDYAARYGTPEQRAAMTAQAERYFAEAVRGVAAFDTRACTRPMAVLLTNGMQRAHARLSPPTESAPADTGVAFGTPSRFQPQKARFRARLATPAGWLAVARAALRPALWQRLLRGRVW